MVNDLNSLRIVTSILGLIQIGALFLATYWAYKIYLFNRQNKLWILFPCGTLLFALRRTFILIEFTYFEELMGKFFFLERVLLPFVIALLITFGIYGLLERFQSFEIIEKDMLKTTAKFTNKKKTKK